MSGNFDLSKLTIRRTYRFIEIVDSSQIFVLRNWLLAEFDDFSKIMIRRKSRFVEIDDSSKIVIDRKRPFAENFLIFENHISVQSWKCNFSADSQASDVWQVPFDTCQWTWRLWWQIIKTRRGHLRSWISGWSCPRIHCQRSGIQGPPGRRFSKFCLSRRGPRFVNFPRSSSGCRPWSGPTRSVGTWIPSKGYGVTLMKRFTDNVLVQWPRESNPQEYQILAMLPFDSTRKMMSVLVRYPKAGFEMIFIGDN